MAERKPKLTKVTDKKQSDQFRKVARELEADGDLNLTEAEKRLDKVIRRSQPQARPNAAQDGEGNT